MVRGLLFGFVMVEVRIICTNFSEGFIAAKSMEKIVKWLDALHTRRKWR